MSDETISLADLLLQCEQAERRMSITNPHRLLIAQCRVALLDLAERLRPKEALPIAVEHRSRDLIQTRGIRLPYQPRGPEHARGEVS